MRRKRKVRCVYIYDRFVLGAADTRENSRLQVSSGRSVLIQRPKNLTKTFELGAKSFDLK